MVSTTAKANVPTILCNESSEVAMVSPPIPEMAHKLLYSATVSSQMFEFLCPFQKYFPTLLFPNLKKIVSLGAFAIIINPPSSGKDVMDGNEVGMPPTVAENMLVPFGFSGVTKRLQLKLEKQTKAKDKKNILAIICPPRVVND
jgi:hypothetical protein